MTISRAKPPGWGVGDKLTSAEQNQVDLNTTYALDKRAGQTDTLASNVTVTGETTFNNRVHINATLDVAGDANFGAGTTVNANSLTAVSAAVSGAATVSGTLQVSGTLTGSLTLTTPRTVEKIIPARPSHVSTSGGVIAGTALGAGIVFGVMATNTVKISTGYCETQAVDATDRRVYMLDANAHFPDGATLVSATLYYRPASGHGALPANFPALSITRASNTAGVEEFLLSTSAGWAIDTAASVAAYEAPRSLVFTPNQNATIDRDVYSYMIRLADEGGANAVANLKFYSVKLTFSVPELIAAAV